MDYICGNEGVTDGRPGERPPRLLDEVRRVLRLRVKDIDRRYYHRRRAGVANWLLNRSRATHRGTSHLFKASRLIGSLRVIDRQAKDRPIDRKLKGADFVWRLAPDQ